VIEIIVAGSPLGKERVRFVKATGRAFTPERTVNYESRVALAGSEAMAGRSPMEGPLEVSIAAYVPIAQSWSKKRQAAALAGTERPTKKPDIDNLIKSLADGLNLVVWIDDSQIVQVTAAKHYSDRPRVEIRVKPITEGGIFA
jgi:Holliday junction resolvase RusA-like endonuclease